MDSPTCNQHNCENPGALRFTWPGRDEAHVCIEHAQRLRNIANAMGMHIQLIPLTIPPTDEGGSK